MMWGMTHACPTCNNELPPEVVEKINHAYVRNLVERLRSKAGMDDQDPYEVAAWMVEKEVLL